jgi:hypothetical protein
VSHGRVLSLILLNALIYEILIEVRGENRKPSLQCVDLRERWNVNWEESESMKPCYHNLLVVEPKGSNITNTKATVKHKPEPFQCSSHPHYSSHRSILILSPVWTPWPKEKKINLKKREHHVELVSWWTKDVCLTLRNRNWILSQYWRS